MLISSFLAHVKQEQVAKQEKENKTFLHLQHAFGCVGKNE
jgi:hypothetical protein